MSVMRVAVLATCLATSAALAQGGAAAPAPAAATSSFQSDAAGVLGRVQQEMVSLEKAMPQNKFGWRPAKGVRSVAEVYLHAASAAYFFGKQLGAEPPAEISAMKDFEKQTTDKAKIEKILTDAFAFYKGALEKLPDSELGTTVNLFGMTLSKRAIAMVGLGHFQEHLGQSIAYARSNGVVPPWSKGEK